jgi:hypothetical protein
MKEINTTMIYDNTFDYLFDQAIEELEKQEKEKNN